MTAEAQTRGTVYAGLWYAEHAMELPPEKDFQEQHAALVDEIATKARALPPFSVGEGAEDPYRKALFEKYRRQGLEH